MTNDDFWKLIDQVDRQALRRGEGYDEEAIEPLIDALTRLSREELEAFEEHLAESLYALDGVRFADAAGESKGSDDGFLYARCFVVALGRELYERTRHDPNLMPKSLNEWCEPLLHAAGGAWQRKTGEEWDYSSRGQLRDRIKHGAVVNG